jgi:hypothetical protein
MDGAAIVVTAASVLWWGDESEMVVLSAFDTSRKGFELASQRHKCDNSGGSNRAVNAEMNFDETR